jgi:hypothetical protein
MTISPFSLEIFQFCKTKYERNFQKCVINGEIFDKKNTFVFIITNESDICNLLNVVYFLFIEFHIIE